MWWILRHVVAIGVLPFTVAVIMPLWIGRATGLKATLPESWKGWLAIVVGLGLLIVGSTLFVGCLRRFGMEGRGTLAPWDPPSELVTSGAYAYVRNPMISGVVLLLLGEALVLRSAPLLEWAGLFFLVSAIHIPILEEPQLKRRFGRAYEEYRRNVTRLVPRLSSWTGPGET